MADSINHSGGEMASVPVEDVRDSLKDAIDPLPMFSGRIAMMDQAVKGPH